jgi:exopolyphosphatase/guanosine-5'-triphosphate,3'-diphosphate pyrophosphatase
MPSSSTWPRPADIQKNPEAVRLTAVVDLGSNSFRLVVYRHEPGGAWSVFDEIRAPVRLSAGMGEDQRLRPERVERALDAVRTFVAFCEQMAVDEVIAAGTSALRRAANGDEVIGAFAAEGLPVRILDGREEAYYGALAILNSTTVRDGFGLDMGGGSVQLMQLTGGTMGESISLPLGAVRTTEGYLSDGDQKAGVKALRKHVRKLVGEHEWFDAKAGPLAAIGGSVRNIASAAQRLAGDTEGRVQGFRLTRDMLGALVEELGATKVDDRGAIPGINPDRGDVILAAAVVLETVLETGGFEHVEVTAAGLREGLFFERYYDGRERPVADDVGRASVETLMLRHEPDARHARRVARHALSIYDGLVAAEVIEPSAIDRRLLEAAALLHDIGRAIGFDNRHKHARYLILDEGLPGFLREDMEDIAQIVRYIPKGTPEADTRVELLSGVLRIAEQLERTRQGDVEDVSVNATKKAVEIVADAPPTATVGVWSAAASTKLLAHALGRDVRVGTG